MSAVDNARRARRDYDLGERLAERATAIADEFRAAGWVALTEAGLDVEDPTGDTVASVGVGASITLDDGTTLDAILALGVSRRTGRVSVLLDPERHDARLVVEVPGTGGRYWWSPRAGAYRDLIANPARWCGLDQETAP